MMIKVDRILIGLVISAPGIVVVIHFCSIKPILYVLLRRSETTKWLWDQESAASELDQGLAESRRLHQTRSQLAVAPTQLPGEFNFQLGDRVE